MKFILIIALLDLSFEVVTWITMWSKETDGVRKAYCLASAFLRLVVCCVTTAVIVGGV